MASPLGDRPRRRALYLWALGGNLYGGTRGTNYHDVLTHAGLIDVAAARLRRLAGVPIRAGGRPRPELIVTKDGLAETVCGHPGLSRPGRLPRRRAGC